MKRPGVRRVSFVGGCAPHAPIPDEHALRAALAHPPALGCSFSGGCAPTPPGDPLHAAQSSRPSRPLSLGREGGGEGHVELPRTRPCPDGRPSAPSAPMGQGGGEDRYRTNMRRAASVGPPAPASWAGESCLDPRTAPPVVKARDSVRHLSTRHNEAGRPCGRPVVCVAPSRAARCRAGPRRARGGGPCRPTPAPHASGGGSRAGSCSPS